MAKQLTLVLHLCFLLFLLPKSIQSKSEEDRKVYVVYMGHNTLDDASASSLHLTMLQEVIGRDAENHMLQRYTNSFHGFSARLTQEEVKKLSAMEGVVSVFLSKKNKLATTSSWDFIGFPLKVNRSTMESDIIIGVFDTGIWPESPSFTGLGYGPPPAKWKGMCDANFSCNNKIIGARYFKADGIYGATDLKSPRDSDGHGTHTASTAAGNIVTNANLLGLDPGTARGGVPRARIAVYKVCWSNGCSDVDILSAFEAAIADGVDLITVSVGLVHAEELFKDAFAIGSFHAMRKQILTVQSAMNEGPMPQTIGSIAPWILSVAAGSKNPDLITPVRLGNGIAVNGVSVNPFKLKGMYPLIYAGDVPNITGGFSGSTSRNATAVIMKSEDVNNVSTPYVASFSSRGPNPTNKNILKPDLTAPGVRILAAWSPVARISQAEGDHRAVPFNMLSGTSMACPHVSGIAAYIKTFNPKWSPAAIKSALMTTASVMSGEVDVEFAYGAGYLNPLAAMKPGLVYDAVDVDYVNFLCHEGYNIKDIRIITGVNSSSCSKDKQPNDLNYPAFVISTLRNKAVNITFSRTVTNVGSAKSRYRASITPPRVGDLGIQIEPNILQFKKIGQKLSFKMSVQTTIQKLDSPIVSGELTWYEIDGVHQVRSPIVVHVP
ncbi:unnamed protein product [Lactuca virosa]|uniref:Cucumisin n=1 Tax=Lactuca virosa TaxID=75947 RepID=A0AAU9NCG6_9ASTR|nr:unnamed protein product [Lactuca virosa]